MFIFQENSNPVIKDSRIFTNKLKNMKLHLTELLNKKLRLEIEIKNLKKTILNRQKEYERTLKIKLTMEDSETLEDPKHKHLLEDFQLSASLQEFDNVSLEIFNLLEEENSLKENEKI